MPKWPLIMGYSIQESSAIYGAAPHKVCQSTQYVAVDSLLVAIDVALLHSQVPPGELEYRWTYLLSKRVSILR